MNLQAQLISDLCGVFTADLPKLVEAQWDVTVSFGETLKAIRGGAPDLLIAVRAVGIGGATPSAAGND
jgi:hypothetical protein